MSEELIELPTGWVWTALEELLRHQNALTYGILKPGDYVSDGVPMLRVMDIGDGKLNDTQLFRVSKALDEEYQRTSLETGDVVLAVMATIGRTMVIPKSLQGANVNRALAVLKLSHLITPEFICWSLRSPYFQKIFIENQLGTAQKRINLAELRKFSVALPPLNEQRRLVAKIEALNARSQRVKEELEAIAPLLDQFRQSVLAAAFRGDLTADWREKNPDVEPALELLAQIQEEYKNRYQEESAKAKVQGGKKPKKPDCLSEYNLAWTEVLELPDSWTIVPLGKVCTKITDGTHDTPKMVNKGIPYITAQHIRNGFIDFENSFFLPESEHKVIYLRCNPTKGDVVIVNIGAGTATPALVDVDFEFSMKNIALLKPIAEILDGKYLEYHQLAIKPTIFSRISRGGAQPFMSLNLIKTIPFRLPPLSEQKEIVRKVKDLFKIADYIQQQYQAAKADLDQFDQSILAKAFRGELVPQDPNDEPASVLLERIRAEREKLDTKKKAKGKTEKKSRKAKPEGAEPEQLSLPGFE